MSQEQSLLGNEPHWRDAGIISESGRAAKLSWALGLNQNVAVISGAKIVEYRTKEGGTGTVQMDKQMCRWDLTVLCPQLWLSGVQGAVESSVSPSVDAQASWSVGCSLCRYSTRCPPLYEVWQEHCVLLWFGICSKFTGLVFRI